jgi:hypothetical protein
MRSLYFGVLLAAATAIAIGQVSPEDHAAHHPDAAAATQDHRSAMKALMEKLRNTSDPAERQRLLDEHRRAMRGQLDSMRHMKCSMEAGKDGSKDAGKDPAGHGGMMAGGGMMKCHEMTVARMDMMIEMMDQMMAHEDAERAPQKKR